MKSRNIVAFVTFGVSYCEEIVHSHDKDGHIHHEQHSILQPQTVNVYNISGRLQYVTVNDVVIATRYLG